MVTAADVVVAGRDWTNDDVCRIRDLPAPDDLKCWIWHATAARGLRYVDGTAALEAIGSLRTVDMGGTRGPASLRDQRVVVTGRFEIGTQDELRDLIEDAGGVVQSAVSDDTSVLVRAHQIDNTVGGFEGRKLFSVRERKRRGQTIHVIDEHRLCRLVGLSPV
ncbi:BRCT domain-containing protein [Gordonia sp. NPDC003429]